MMLNRDGADLLAKTIVEVGLAFLIKQYQAPECSGQSSGPNNLE
jgi:hypothetical protein